MVVGGTPDERLAAVAHVQHAHISREQLLVIGFTPAMIKTRLLRRTLHRRHRNVYAVGHGLDLPLGNETAALLAVGPAGVLSHRSAAFVLGLVPTAPLSVDVTVGPGTTAKSRPGIAIHVTRSLTAKDLGSHHRLPITSAARVLVDLADRPNLREVERALDEGLHRHLVTPAAIRATIERNPGRRGAPILIALLDPDRPRGITRSQAERRLLRLIRDAGLPSPERNVRFGPFEVDMVWRERRLVVEIDSYAWHSGPWAFKRDHRKDAYLTDHGLEVLRVTWEMMDKPLPLIARIARRV